MEMKKIIISTLCLVVVSLLSFNFASAVILEGYSSQIILKEGSSIDIDKLATFCPVGSEVQTCIMVDNEYNKELTFKLDESTGFSARYSKEDNYYSLYAYDWNEESNEDLVFENLQSALNLLVENEIVIGLTSEDVESISAAAKPNSIIYFKDESCGSSHVVDSDNSGLPQEEVDAIIYRLDNSGESGWLVSNYGCGISFISYQDGCPQINHILGVACIQSSIEFPEEIDTLQVLSFSDEEPSDEGSYTKPSATNSRNNYLIYYIVLAIILVVALAIYFSKKKV